MNDKNKERKEESKGGQCWKPLNMTIYLTDSVVVLLVWWWVVVCKHETVSQGEIVSLQFDKSHPILQKRGKDVKLYNDVNASRDVISRCPWSIRVQTQGWS